MQPQEIQNLLQQGLPESEVTVTGDGTHFEAVIVTPAFEGKGLLERHRMVYGVLGDRMRADIHALSMRTFTPQEWAAQSGG